MKNPKKILIIIQRSNGDVFLSLTLINALYNNFHSPQIDLLVNDDTIAVAKLLPNINFIHIFSYKKKHEGRWGQEKNLIKSIFRQYELSINLTASDRSVIYALLASKNSISAIEKENKKSWWKKILLTNHYYFDVTKHILLNNLESLKFLNIEQEAIQNSPNISEEVMDTVRKKLSILGISDFIIFHPSTQYRYKIYPQLLRNELLSYLSNLGISILITGSRNQIDTEIKKELPSLPNIIDFIGETTLEEYFALCKLSLAYIGMDTLNMHIAAAQDKRIFSIFGPTNLAMWSPWSNILQKSTKIDMPLQNYGNVTIFQANMYCVACGKAGCDDNGVSECLNKISPKTVFKEVQNWYENESHKSTVSVVTNLVRQTKKVLLYIVYGKEKGYYDGAKFSFLTFLNWKSDEDLIEIVILTEKPEEFIGYPVTVIPMSTKQKTEWSLGNKYHFRIKNRGLAYIMDKLELKEQDKILFFDTDTYFNKSPLPLFNLIQPNQALYYLNEGLIYKRKRFDAYVKHLKGRRVEFDGQFYELTKESAMWGSLMIGIMPNMRSSLEWADRLMIKLFDIVPSHTIEPFSLSEVLLKKYKMVEGKKFVSLYSTSRKKDYAVKILSKFFKQNQSLPVSEQIYLAQKVKLQRPLHIIIKQRLLKVS